MSIPFSKTYYTGNEIKYITQAMDNYKLSGDGEFTKKCEKFLEDRYSVQRVLLTTSCTDALELSALLCHIGPDDEVIVPSFTFVSTALAFVMRGAKIVFCDSKTNHPNMDEELLESLITKKTKAIIPVHYGGVPCEMDRIMEIADKYNIYVIEDAAQAIESKYNDKQLGTIGHLGVFSFHDTKNISAGEGGAILINDSSMIDRSEIIREKGTNRKAFFKGAIDKYGWVDYGSSHLPSELNAAFLYAQLESMDTIQELRLKVWDFYRQNIQDSKNYMKPNSSYRGNAHVYFLKFQNQELRDKCLSRLREESIAASFHFLPLEDSRFVKEQYSEKEIASCPKSKDFSDTILRLPLYAGVSEYELRKIVNLINKIVSL